MLLWNQRHDCVCYPCYAYKVPQKRINKSMFIFLQDQKRGCNAIRVVCARCPKYALTNHCSYLCGTKDRIVMPPLLFSQGAAKRRLDKSLFLLLWDWKLDCNAILVMFTRCPKRLIIKSMFLLSWDQVAMRSLLFSQGAQKDVLKTPRPCCCETKNATVMPPLLCPQGAKQGTLTNLWSSGCETKDGIVMPSLSFLQGAQKDAWTISIPLVAGPKTGL